MLSTLALTLAGLVLGAAPSAVAPAGAYPLGEGYWLAATDGGMFTYGDAQFLGSLGNVRLNRPIVGMAAHPFLEGYWLVASDGGIFSFGSSGYFGSTGNITLNKPIVGMAPTPTGLGYWLVATDGGIFSFGDATFYGSTGDLRLNKPIVGMAATPSGGGYYLVASDGGIFTYGDAVFRGSTGDIRLNAPIVGMALSRSGNGYQFVATDGGIFNYGDSQFHGSAGNLRLNQPILGMAVRPAFAVKVDAYQPDSSQTSNWVDGGGGDWQLSLTYNGGATPAGARVYGVEGLDVSQLGTIGFTLRSGACAPSFVLYYDTTGDGAADAQQSFPCATGGSGAVKSWNPQAAGVPAGAVVTALDISSSAPGTVAVDDVTAAGLTAGDWQVARQVP